MQQLSDEQIAKIEQEKVAYEEWRKSFLSAVEKTALSYTGYEWELQEGFLEGRDPKEYAKEWVIEAMAIDLT